MYFVRINDDMINDLKFKIFLILISVFSFFPSVYAATCGAGSDANVSELEGYTQIYQLDIPSNANYGANTPAYGIDNSTTTIDNGIVRIGYYLELQKDGICETEWVWVSMDAFTQNLGEIGVPVSNTGAIWQQSIDNMNVESNVTGIVTGTEISTGNIEFWHHCYRRDNDAAVLNARDDIFDFGDLLRSDSPSCYGSMQLHNNSEEQTLFAWNDWDRSIVDDIGIGNQLSTNSDWTFADNANDYSLRNIEVWVLPTDRTKLSILDLSANGGINPSTGNYWSAGDIDQVYDVSSYGGSSQDLTGTVEVQDASLSLFIEGNRWQKVDFPYTVTEDTVIEFDFQSTEQTEVSGLGFDDDLAISANRSFKLYGTQTWGISDFNTYEGNGITHYTIPVGQFYTGDFDYLFFINDDDNNPTGNSLYSNIIIYEGERPKDDCSNNIGDATLILCEGFETPDITTSSQNLPSGWIGTGDYGLNDDSLGLFSTPYDEQVLWIDNGSVSTTSANLSEVLTANVIYTLSFNVAKRTDLDGNYNVELLAGNTVLASVIGTPTQSDFSESNEIIFSATATHENLGETLQVRISTNGLLQPQFDNVSLTAVTDNRLLVSIESEEQRYDVSSYGGTSQDNIGTVEVKDFGASLFIEGNRWQKIDFPYTVTEDTIIEFDFESTEQTEISGLGFDDDLAISSNRSFKVYGTQNWGITDFNNYSGSGITHYSIPVGEFYTGDFDYLFFINDDDSNPTGNSSYSNINVYENNNLIADYRMDESSWSATAGEVIDETGSFNAQSVNGALTADALRAIPGDPGTCSYGSFDGVDDYIVLPGSFENLNESFTITAWINPDNVNSGSRIFTDDENNDQEGYGFSLGDAGNGELRFYSRGVEPIFVDTAASIVPDTWTFVAAVHDSVNQTRQIFINGVAQTITGGGTSHTYTETWGIDGGPASIGGETDSGETNNRFTGNIDEVRVYKRALTENKIASIFTETHACNEPVIHHYEIVHDGQGLTCDAEPITIKACMNSDCSILSSQSVSLDLQATNTSGTTIKNSFTFVGSTDVDAGFSHVAVETLDLSVANATVMATNSVVCDDGSGTSCNIAFSDTGFIFGNDNVDNSLPIIPTQLSGKPSNIGFNAENLFIQAVRTDTNSGSCIGVFPDGGDVPINLSYTCHADSSACTSNLELINNSTPKSIKTNVTEQSLRFDSNSTAYFTLNYPDAGKLTINAQKDIDVDGLGEIKSFDSSSNTFVVRPFGLYLDLSENGNIDNMLADDALGSAFKKAGETFSLRATAKQWATAQDVNNDGIPDDFTDLSANNTANNFDDEQLNVTRTLFLPNDATANTGLLTAETSNTFNSSILDNNYNYSEVGIIHLSASLSSSLFGGTGYLGAGDIQGYIANVGRFTPAYFIQTVESHGSLNANHGADAACIINDWAYSGQETDSDGSIRYDALLPPIALITPYNTAGIITENYTASGFMKLEAADITVDEPTEDNEQPRITPDVIDEKVNITSQMSEGDLSATVDAGVLRYEFNSTDNFIYEHNEHSLYAPFPAKIPFVISQIEDEDGINLYSGSDVAITATESILTEGVEVRFGRWRIESGFGPETSNLLMPMLIEEYNGTSFMTNSDESCIEGSLGNKFTSGIVGSGGLSLWDYRLVDVDTTDNLLTSDSNASISTGTVFDKGIHREFFLSAPLGNKQGSFEVEYEVPLWLQFDWNGDGVYKNNPSATATFGVFRGNDRIIYTREVFN